MIEIFNFMFDLGAVFKNRAFLYLYAVILTLLIIAEIGAFIATFSSRVHIRDSYEYGLRSLFIEIYKKNETELKYVIEDVEREFQCCGVYNVTDYYQNNFTVPAACHEDENFQKPIFNKGCARAAIEWVWNQFPIIGGALGGVLLIEIFGVVSSIALGIAISHSNYDKLYH
jgi:CD63 antigen